MNYLLDNLPTEIDGIKIDTDYRRMVQFELLMFDEAVPPADKIKLAINLLYREPILSVEDAWSGLLKYYSVDEKMLEKGQNNGSTIMRAYDFEKDHERIYVAFLQVYKIDLQKEALHWYTFKALLQALPDDCLMGKLMYYRTCDISRLSKDEQNVAREIRKKFPTTKTNKSMTKAQREAEFLARIDKRQKEVEKIMAERGKR